MAEQGFLGYNKAVMQFVQITAHIKPFIQSLLDEQFLPSNGMLWGMSYGAQIMLNIGKSLGGLIGKGHCKYLVFFFLGVYGNRANVFV